MSVNEHQPVETGWQVVGSDGRKIGRVRSVHDDHLVVEHGLISKRALYVPIDALAEVRAEVVVLGLPASQAGEMGWHVRPGSTRSQPAQRTGGGGDMTTMTGTGFGAGGGAAAAGPLEPTRGDSIHDRFGGSGRAGLGRSQPFEDDEAVDDDPAPDATREIRER